LTASCKMQEHELTPGVVEDTYRERGGVTVGGAARGAKGGEGSVEQTLVAPV
jgi:hypothetical protein